MIECGESSEEGSEPSWLGTHEAVNVGRVDAVRTADEFVKEPLKQMDKTISLPFHVSPDLCLEPVLANAWSFS